jgi:hypothetical protein
MREPTRAKGGQYRGDRHRGDIFYLELVPGGVDSQLGQHVGQLLGIEIHIGAVAGAVQPHHQAVADELVGTHPFERRDVLQADGVGGDGQGADEHGQHHQAPQAPQY